MCSVPTDPMPRALTVSVTVGLRAGVGSTAKRKAVQVCSIKIVPDVVPATALLSFATVTRVGLDEVVRNPLALVPQCAATMGNARPSVSPRSAPVIKGGWVELARLNASMVRLRKQPTVHISASVMVATVV